MPYDIKKGFAKPKVEKANRQKFLTLQQLRILLECVRRMEKPRWRRDHAAIYLGFHFGLRCAEACILERESFRFIADGQAHIRTAKSAPRLPLQCECGRRWRVSIKRAGARVRCPACASRVQVRSNNPGMDTRPPERQPPVVETQVIAYIQRYLTSMRPEQRWLFESRPGQHLCTTQLRRIFNYYVVNCEEIDNIYSFHALRHGRGVLIYERFQDHVMVRDMLRQKSLSSAEWYMHLSPERAREYRGVLDSAYEETLHE